jgi:hypothetical protein
MYNIKLFLFICFSFTAIAPSKASFVTNSSICNEHQQASTAINKCNYTTAEKAVEPTTKAKPNNKKTNIAGQIIGYIIGFVLGFLLFQLLFKKQ